MKARDGTVWQQREARMAGMCSQVGIGEGESARDAG